jgi:D-alanine-D-alanine ligase
LVKDVLRDLGIPTPDWKIYQFDNRKDRWGGKFPSIVKSTTEHGSMSIHQDAVVTNVKKMRERVEMLLEKYRGIPVMVEEYIDGREVNSTVIGSYEWARCLPLSEMVFGGVYKKGGKWPIYTYEAKYNHNTPEFDDVPAKIVDWLKPNEVEKIEKMSFEACEKTECFDYARIDLRYDTRSHTPYFVDLNSYPCLLEDTIYDTIGISRAALGWDFTRLLKEIAKSGIRRYEKQHKKGSSKSDFTRKEVGKYAI